jgi:hypothetical protein
VSRRGWHEAFDVVPGRDAGGRGRIGEAPCGSPEDGSPQNRVVAAPGRQAGSEAQAGPQEPVHGRSEGEILVPDLPAPEGRRRHDPRRSPEEEARQPDFKRLAKPSRMRRLLKAQGQRGPDAPHRERGVAQLLPPEEPREPQRHRRRWGFAGRGDGGVREPQGRSHSFEHSPPQDAGEESCDRPCRRAGWRFAGARTLRHAFVHGPGPVSKSRPRGSRRRCTNPGPTKPAG